MPNTRLACVALASCLAAAAAGAAPQRPAPDCALKIAGESSSVRHYRGQVLYLDFWASWCAPCLLSFPFMNTLEKDLGGRGVRVVAIDMDRNADEGARFLVRHPARFAIAAEGGEACARAFGVQAMPTSFIIDQEGAIRQVHAGFLPSDAARLRTAVEKVLGSSPAAGGAGR